MDIAPNSPKPFVSSSHRVARKRVSRWRIEKYVSIRALDTLLTQLLGRYSTRTVEWWRQAKC